MSRDIVSRFIRRWRSAVPGTLCLVVGGGTMGVGNHPLFLGHGWKVDVVSRWQRARACRPPARALAAMHA